MMYIIPSMKRQFAKNLSSNWAVYAASAIISFFLMPYILGKIGQAALGGQGIQESLDGRPLVQHRRDYRYFHHLLLASCLLVAILAKTWYNSYKLLWSTSDKPQYLVPTPILIFGPQSGQGKRL